MIIGLGFPPTQKRLDMAHESAVPFNSTKAECVKCGAFYPKLQWRDDAQLLAVQCEGCGYAWWMLPKDAAESRHV
jgi:Zn ribbon nucleic-acid-binding protein